MDSKLKVSGNLSPRLIKAAPADVHQVRIPGVGRVWFTKDQGKSVLPAHMVLATDLKLDVVRNGKAIDRIDLGTEHMELGSGVVTTAGVNFMASAFTGGSAISLFNYHDSGTGTTAEAIGQTVLVTQAGPATRATGTQSNPSANQYRSVGTIAYTSTLAITEWGLFSQAAQGGTMWDRRVFSAVNVVNGDSIQFTYTLTINAGG